MRVGGSSRGGHLLDAEERERGEGREGGKEGGMVEGMRQGVVGRNLALDD